MFFAQLLSEFNLHPPSVLIKEVLVHIFFNVQSNLFYEVNEIWLFQSDLSEKGLLMTLEVGAIKTCLI